MKPSQLSAVRTESVLSVISVMANMVLVLLEAVGSPLLLVLRLARPSAKVGCGCSSSVRDALLFFTLSSSLLFVFSITSNKTWPLNSSCLSQASTLSMPQSPSVHTSERCRRHPRYCRTKTSCCSGCPSSSCLARWPWRGRLGPKKTRGKNKLQWLDPKWLVPKWLRGEVSLVSVFDFVLSST